MCDVFILRKEVHHKIMCITKCVHKVNEVNSSVFLRSVTAGGDPWMIELGVGKKKVQFKIEMGLMLPSFQNIFSTRLKLENAKK